MQLLVETRVKSLLATPWVTTVTDEMSAPPGRVEKVRSRVVVWWRSTEPKLTGLPGERPWAWAEEAKRARRKRKRLERNAASERRCLLG